MSLALRAGSSRGAESTCARRQRRSCFSVRVAAVSTPSPLSPAEARELLLSKSALFVDVRSPREWRSEAIAGCVCVPLYEVLSTVPLGAVDSVLVQPELRERLMPLNTGFEKSLKEALGSQGKARRVVLVCSNGARSEEAARLLAEEEYQTTWLEGGMTAWLGLYSASGVPRKRVVAGVFRDTSSRNIWTDSAEEDTVLAAPGGNTRDLPD